MQLSVQRNVENVIDHLARGAGARPMRRSVGAPASFLGCCCLLLAHASSLAQCQAGPAGHARQLAQVANSSAGEASNIHADSWISAVIERGTLLTLHAFKEANQHSICPLVFCACAAGRDSMQLYTVAHIDPLAICNDGSPGAYYHRPGTEDGSTRCLLLNVASASLSLPQSSAWHVPGRLRG